MIGCTFHIRGQKPEQRLLHALPRRGDYLDQDGTLYVVQAVALVGDEFHLYAVPCADALTRELRRTWASWGVPQPEVEV